MFRFILFFYVSLLVWTSACFAEDPIVRPVNEEKIQKILNKWRSSSGISAASLSVYMPGHSGPLTFTSGTSQNRGGFKVDKNTLFQAGSITKSFTSIIILKLEAEGRLSINDPITHYLPQYPQWNNVTIRQLLNHTSGIPNYTNTGRFNLIRKKTPTSGFSPAQLVNLAGKRRLFAPGKGWKYSNTNYVLAGMIIEKVTGNSVQNIMKNFISSSSKAELPNTFYISGKYPDTTISRMAHGYTSDGKDVINHDMSWASTAGAVVSTSEDLLMLWYDLLQGKILPPKQLKKMMSLVCEGRTSNCLSGERIPNIKAGEVGYGYGLGIIQMCSGSSSVGPVWWHNGTTAGYRAIVMWFPKSDIYMSLMVNRGAGYLLKPTVPIIRNIMSVLDPHVHPTFAYMVSTKVDSVSTKVKHLAHRSHKKTSKSKHVSKTKKAKKKHRTKKPAKVTYKNENEDFYRGQTAPD